MTTVLYCIMNPCCMSKALVHRLDVNKQKKAILLVDFDVFQRRGLLPVVDNFITNNIFTDVIQEKLFFECSKKYEIENYENYIIKYYDTVLEKNGYHISEFDEVVVANDWWDGRFNLYLNIVKKQYIWLQTDPNNLQENVRFQCTDECRMVFDKYSALSAFAPFARPWITSNCNNELILKVKNIDNVYDYNKAIKKISYDIVKKVVDCYGIKSINKNSILFMPNSYGYMYGGLTKEQKENCNFDYFGNEEILFQNLRMICDYYLNDVDIILVKPHPNDPIKEDKIHNLMGRKATLLTEAPWEWTNVYLTYNNFKFKCIIGIASTSLDSIDEKICNKKIIMGNSFLKTWYFYDQLAIMQLLLQTKYKQLIAHKNIYEQVVKLGKQLKLEYEYELISYDKMDTKINNCLFFVDCFEFIYQYRKLNEYINELAENSTLVVFNLDAVGYYLDSEKLKYVSVIEVTTISNGANYVDLYEKSNIYIFSTDKTVHSLLRNSEFDTYMPNRKIKMSIRVVSKNELINTMYTRKYREELLKLTKQNEINRQRIDNLLTVFSCEKNYIKDKLRKIVDISMYLDVLQVIKNDCIIVLAIKDTVGDCLSNEIIERLRQFGFSSINKETWRMYVGIVSNEICIDKVADSREEPVNESICIYNKLIDVSSNAWRKNNCAKIIINGIDYAINMRGLNLVVVDKTTGQVWDSIGYDAHTEITKFARKNTH